MSAQPPSDEQRERAREAIARAKAARAAERVELAPGVVLYPDAPPGVGWVLERRGQVLRFFKTKEDALLAYEQALQ